MHHLERAQLEEKDAREAGRVRHDRQRVVDFGDRHHPRSVSRLMRLAHLLAPGRERRRRVPARTDAFAAGIPDSGQITARRWTGRASLLLIGVLCAARVVPRQVLRE